MPHPIRLLRPLAPLLLALLLAACATTMTTPMTEANNAPLDRARALYKAGRYAEAEPFLRQELAAAEQAGGPQAPAVATALNNLGVLYMALGRYPAAEPLFQRAITIREAAHGPEDPLVATSLNELGVLYVAQARYPEAEPFYQRALTIREAALGELHPQVGQSLSNLGVLKEALGQEGEALPLYERALRIQEKVLGPDHPDVAATLNNLGVLYRKQGRPEEAREALERALFINEKTLRPDHPKVAASLNNLAVLHAGQERYPDAVAAIRRAAEIQRLRVLRDSLLPTPGAPRERLTRNLIFPRYVEIGWQLARRDPAMRAELADATFQAAQLASASDTAAATERVAARFAKGDSELARLIRRQQDLAEEWWTVDQALVVAVGQPPAERDPALEGELRRRFDEVGKELDRVRRETTERFPEYAELVSPEPAGIAEIQALLAADEALLTYFDIGGGDGACLWLLRRDRAEMYKIPLAPGELDRTVRALRARLDPGQMGGTLAPFDLQAAHALYGRLFPMPASMLAGVRQLLIVPHGALQSLPFSVLVRTPPAEGASYRTADWLIRDYATTTLPSVSSLRGLRGLAKPSQAAEPFRGIGDPVLAGYPGRERGFALTTLIATRTLADPDEVRRLPSLPETADELRNLARALGAGESSLILADAATERTVKEADLDRARVLAFATHAGIAGEIEGVAEPALVLTPPPEASEEDDGLLTASEAAQLELDAEFVLLSACNTAAPDGTPGAAGLSGLTKAFIYAGSRALMVSHWQVISDAAAVLTTGMFDELARDPALDRSEALRRSMLAVLDQRRPAYFSHPAAWAPFVIVGQGGPLVPPEGVPVVAAGGG